MEVLQLLEAKEALDQEEVLPFLHARMMPK